MPWQWCLISKSEPGVHHYLTLLAAFSHILKRKFSNKVKLSFVISRRVPVNWEVEPPQNCLIQILGNSAVINPNTTSFSRKQPVNNRQNTTEEDTGSWAGIHRCCPAARPYTVHKEKRLFLCRQTSMAAQLHRDEAPEDKMLLHLVPIPAGRPGSQENIDHYCLQKTLLIKRFGHPGCRQQRHSLICLLTAERPFLFLPTRSRESIQPAQSGRRKALHGD